MKIYKIISLITCLIFCGCYSPSINESSLHFDQMLNTEGSISAIYICERVKPSFNHSGVLKLLQPLSIKNNLKKFRKILLASPEVEFPKQYVLPGEIIHVAILPRQNGDPFILSFTTVDSYVFIRRGKLRGEKIYLNENRKYLVSFRLINSKELKDFFIDNNVLNNEIKSSIPDIYYKIFVDMD